MGVERLARIRAHLKSQRQLCRIRTPVHASLDEARVEERLAGKRMRGPGENLSIDPGRVLRRSRNPHFVFQNTSRRFVRFAYQDRGGRTISGPNQPANDRAGELSATDETEADRAGRSLRIHLLAAY